jgi:hypothetical protein
MLTQLFNLLMQHKWAGAPLFFWIIWLWPSSNKDDKKAKKALPPPQHTRQRAPVLTPTCRHQEAVPVRTCDWRPAVLAGDHELVSWFCPRCKEQLPRKFSPGVREVDAATGREVSRVYGGIVDYWTTEAKTAAHVPNTAEELARYLTETGFTPADVVEVNGLGDSRAVFLPKNAEAEQRFRELYAKGYQIMRVNGELVWKQPPLQG